MKKKVKRTLTLLTACLFMLTIGLVTANASPDPIRLPYAKKFKINMMSYYMVFTNKTLKNGEIVKAKVKNANGTEDLYLISDPQNTAAGDKKTAFYFDPIDGKNVITITVKPGDGGKNFKLKSTVTVVPSESVFKYLTVGGQSFSVGYHYSPDLPDKAKVKFKLNNGWKMKSCYIGTFNGELIRAKKLKSGKTVTFNQTNRALVFLAYNKKTNTYMMTAIIH